MARGHVRKRGDAWELRVSAGSDPVTGRRRVVSRTFRGSKRDADKALTALLRELDDGAHRGPDATLGVLMDRWWERGRTTWAANTRRGYADYRRHYIEPHEDRRLRDVTPEWLDGLYSKLLDRLAPATVYKVHRILSDALGDAVRWGWLASNPADRAQPPSVKRRPIVTPDTASLRDAVTAVVDSDPDYGTLLHLEAVAGLRPGELLALQWRDLRGSDLTIRRTLGVDENRKVHVQSLTKTDKVRVVPLDAGTLALLEDHRLRWKDRAAAGGQEMTGEWYLFPRRADPLVPMNPQQVTRWWGRRRKALGLAGVRVYDLRHAMVTRLLDQGVPVHDVAARAGHDASMTLRRYAHPSTEGGRRAADAAGL